MDDMRAAIIPKSTQWNYDDFLSGPITFKITGVKVRPGTEQPVEISMEGTDKFYLPCKSMSRCLVAAWGPDSAKYAGRSLTLYGDPSIKWGGLAVGGIRISHLSDIPETLTMALTATKGSRRPFTVRPLKSSPPQPTLPAASPAAEAASVDSTELAQLLITGQEAAEWGMSSYEAFWKALSKQERATIGPDRHEAWKAIAQAVPG